MARTIIRMSCVALIGCFLLCLPPWADVLAQESARPLIVVPSEGYPEVQVDEDANQGGGVFVIYGKTKILGTSKLRTIDIGDRSEKVHELLTSERTTRFFHDRFLSTDGKTFGHRSPGGKRLSIDTLTVARVHDNRVLHRVEGSELFEGNWPRQMYLADDGSHFIAAKFFDTRIRGRKKTTFEVVRFDFDSSTKKTASYDLGNRNHHIHYTGGNPGLVTVTSVDENRPPKMQSFYILDQNLKLLHRQEIPQSYFPVSVVNPRDPVLLLIFSGRHMFDSWRLVRRSEQGYVFAGEAVSRPLVALGQTFQAGAISPDRKWFVTAQTAAKPMLAIWSTSTGKTVREVVIEGGTHGKPLNTLIRRLAFSKSGRYLSACDGDNAYLMEFKDLLDLTELTSPGNF